MISVSMADRSPENGALTFACPTGQVHAVIVSEAVAIRQAGQSAPDEPAIDLGWTFHVPDTDRLWTWRPTPASAIT
jgi:hypothetical protein